MVSLSGSLKARTVLVAITLITACASFPPTSADAVYLNGKIITVDKAFTIAQAVAVKDGRSSVSARRRDAPIRIADHARRGPEG
jgi:hypothetical protein